MRTMTRLGIAAAAALVFSPPAKACDPNAFDPRDDAGRYQICPPEEQQGRATRPDDEKGQDAKQAKQDQARMSGSGSGEPSAARKRRPALPPDDYPHGDWTPE